MRKTPSPLQQAQDLLVRLLTRRREVVGLAQQTPYLFVRIPGYG